MGYGLGKNSPVVLSLGKSNFEALIERHGQFVRWRVSRKCACVNDMSNQPDVRCPKCGGSGERYDFQECYEDSMRLGSRGDMVELPSEHIDCDILRVVDYEGREYEHSKMGQYVELFNEQKSLSTGEMVDVIFRESIIKIIEETTLIPVGNGFYRVPGVQSDRSKIEGVNYTAAGDIVDIGGGVFDAHGNEVDIREYRRDTVLLKDSGAVQSLTAFGVKYLKPFKFIVLSQNLNEEDTRLVSAHSGDAVCVFPYAFNVSEGDVMTVLSGTQTRKIVQKCRGESCDDTIPEFFVDRISCLETGDREYIEGQDFIIVGTNKIHWICENPPGEGTNIAIVYQYFPTYRVVKNVPMLRTGEDQQIPRKVILRLFSGFSESRGVNRQ
jgi:hypothetical protein